LAGYIGSAIDVTERKLAEEALSTVSQKLIEAQEEERTRIARELHDEINQRLVLLAVNLETLKRDLPVSSRQAKRRIEEANKDVGDLASDIQALSHRLHSSKLEYWGLAAAASFCKELSERQNVEIDFHSDSLPKSLPKETSLCLFRVLQEALQNATKHSGARHFEVSLKSDGSNEIQLSVHDSGVGFDPEQAIKGSGLGLTSMKERLKLVDGQLFIDSKPQGGTSIYASVPLMKSAAAAG
jgi:signal transduction histidine kinase